ncbi:MAG: hypothetical protein R6U68_02570 [Desulfobacteraceae bacterium]
MIYKAVVVFSPQQIFNKITAAIPARTVCDKTEQYAYHLRNTPVSEDFTAVSEKKSGKDVAYCNSDHKFAVTRLSGFYGRTERHPQRFPVRNIENQRRSDFFPAMR